MAGRPGVGKRWHGERAAPGHGAAGTRAEAVEAASDALVVAAMDRGRQEYRSRAADTLMVVIPGLTEQGDVDLFDLAATVPGFECARR